MEPGINGASPRATKSLVMGERNQARSDGSRYSPANYQRRRQRSDRLQHHGHKGPMVKEQRNGLRRPSQPNSPWFLDSCASRHLCNDCRLFSSTRAKSIDFVTAAGQIIQTEEVGTVSIPLTGGTTIELHNVALAPDCDSKLISLGQLREGGITYHDNPATMTMMRGRKIIAHAKRNHNPFTLDSAVRGSHVSN